MLSIEKINELLPESMFYPCSEDDGTPIKRCQNMFPLYIYADYSIPKERLINRLRNHHLVETKEFSAEEFFGKTWQDLEREYSEYIKKLPLEYENPYIIACDFENDNTHQHIITINIRFEAIAVLEELYLKRGITPKGLTHIKCGIGFGGNYAGYPKILNEKLLSSKSGLPKYILCDSLCMPGHGDYLPIIRMYKKINTWEYYRPAYREYGYDFLYELKELRKYNLLEILRSVNVEGSDDGNKFTNETRRNAVIDIIENNPKISLLYKDRYVLMYTTEITDFGDIVLISCHIDHVFRKDELFIEEKNGYIRGTLDNSASIACLLYSLQEYDFPDNVIITFTGGEEEGFLGAEATRDILEDNFEELYDRIGLVVTLDISPDNTDKDISIENLNYEKGDFEQSRTRFESLEEMETKIRKIFENSGINIGFKIEAEPDESHFYAEWDFNTLSLCLPCECPDGDCHSRQGCITNLDKMYKFAKGIKIILDLVK